MREPIALNGSPGSPYTRKMLAVLRYRRIPYRLLIGNPPDGMPKPKVRLLPTFYLPDDTGVLQPVTDSTPLINRLDREIAGREVRPKSPALAFIDVLIEDYGDEWLTKAMFHYRWVYRDDIDKSGTVLPNWMNGPHSDEKLAELSKWFSERQIGRLRFVGSNEVTGPTIEAGYQRLISILERHLKTHPFLLGGRPGAGDFGLFGQLTQLAAFDPTPMALTVKRAPRVVAWTAQIEDLSGLDPKDGDWFDTERLPVTVRELLGEIGRVYAPLLLANAAALEKGLEDFVATVEGKPWRQQTFPYQAKCLKWMRDDYAALSPADRASVDRILTGTGCEKLFA